MPAFQQVQLASIASAAGGPPVFDATSSGGASSTTTNITHVCTGSNRALYTAVFHWIDGDNTHTATATYNSVSMTKIATKSATDIMAAGGVIDLFRLVAPASGSNTVSVVISTAPTIVRIVNVSYTAVNQVTSEGGATASDSDSGGDPFAASSLDITSATGELAIDAILAQTTLTPGVGQTQRGSIVSGGWNLYMSEKAGEATVNFAWTLAVSGSYMVAGCSLKP